MATRFNILAWRMPMDRGAWRATVHGVERVGHDWVTKPPHTLCCFRIHHHEVTRAATSESHKIQGLGQ